MGKHTPQRMTVRSLINWEDSVLPHQDAATLEELLADAGVDPADSTAQVVCSWPDHVLVPMPNGDMSVCSA